VRVLRRSGPQDRAEQWELGTPCTRWTVRDLVNHVVGEDLWTPPLFGGATVAEVGDRFAGDVLGTDPPAASDAAAAAAMSAVAEPDAIERTVHVSFGDISGEEYAWQLAFDHLVHAWDLGRAIGTDPTFDPAVVRACAAWFEHAEELYRDWRGDRCSRGDAGERVPAAAAGGPHRPRSRLGPHDGSGAAARPGVRGPRRRGDRGCFTEDGLFDATTPAPDGAVVEGTDALRARGRASSPRPATPGSRSRNSSAAASVR
jgi:uncharacterized protein (TIGR03086 family)